MPRTTIMTPGHKLMSGAVVLAARIHPGGGYVILADTCGLSGHKYATWRCYMSNGHDAEQGHYFHKVSEAAKDFEDR